MVGSQGRKGPKGISARLVPPPAGPLAGLCCCGAGELCIYGLEAALAWPMDECGMVVEGVEFCQQLHP